LKDTLLRQEALRRMSGSDPVRFEAILSELAGSNPAETLLKYCRYRNDIEARKNPVSFLTDSELMELTLIAYQEITRW
jgi:hypothetical protein